MLLLVDLDGVVYRGAAPVPGVADVLAARAARGDSVVYVTNNSMHYRADYVRRLGEMGAPVTPDRVVSSARATALYLAGLDGVRRVLVVGAGGLERECRDVGLDVVTAAHAASLHAREGLNGWDAAGGPDAVVVGLDPQFTYQKLTVAVDCIRRGARFVATNRAPRRMQSTATVSFWYVNCGSSPTTTASGPPAASHPLSPSRAWRLAACAAVTTSRPTSRHSRSRPPAPTTSTRRTPSRPAR